jgi:hypothetical protein
VNFRLAQQICGQKFGIKIETLIISDSEFCSNYRGIAKGIFLYKLLGASAEKGVGLRELRSYGLKILRNIGSGSEMGLGGGNGVLGLGGVVRVMLDRII